MAEPLPIPSGESEHPTVTQPETPVPVRKEPAEEVKKPEGFQPTAEPFKEESAEGLITFKEFAPGGDRAGAESLEGLETHKEFEPLEETLDIEGFTIRQEFKPPPKATGGPELGNIGFADELGIETTEQVETTPEQPETTAVSPPGEEPEMLTVTMAEIYAGQGQTEKAISIYEAILRDAEDTEDRERITQRLEHLKKIREAQD